VGKGAPYNLYSSLETSYTTTGHNITITGLPDVTVSGNSPTHINLVVKDMSDNWMSIADTPVT
jgi:hypothetical protein